MNEIRKNLEKLYGFSNIYIGQSQEKDLIEIDLLSFDAALEPLKICVKRAQDTDSKWRAAHNSMLAAYRIGDMSCAAKDCKDAKALAPKSFDGYYKHYTSRIIKLTVNPASEDWDGVTTYKSLLSA